MGGFGPHTLSDILQGYLEKSVSQIVKGGLIIFKREKKLRKGKNVFSVVNSKCREQAWPGSRQHTAYVGVGGLSPLPPFTQQLHMKPEARKLKE